MQNRIVKSHEQALGAFVAKKAEIDALLLGSKRSATITSATRRTM
jgi:hypothetical protein